MATIPAYERVERVLTSDLVGDGQRQLIILSGMGQLESIRVINIEGSRARIVLDTAGTAVKIVNKPNAAVLVYSKTANQTEVFEWVTQPKKFKRIATKPGPPKCNSSLVQRPLFFFHVLIQFVDLFLDFVFVFCLRIQIQIALIGLDGPFLHPFFLLRFA
jgi:hypothetical protein